MTPWEWSLVALTIAPVVVCVSAVFLQKPQAERGSAAFLFIAGGGGVVAGLLGAVADAPFTQQTAVFFGMVAAVDKFSSILLLPFALTLAIGALTRWSVPSQRGENVTLRWCALAALSMCVTGVMMVTNIVALAAALFGMVASLVVLAAVSGATRITITRWAFIHVSGVLSIIAGWFVLSSGALFNDFSTISYIAAELDTARLAIAFALILFGVCLFASAWVCGYTKVSLIRTLAEPMERAIAHVGFAIVPVYVLLRVLLFVLPPLTQWYAFPIVIVGLVAWICAKHRLAHQGFHATMPTHLAGTVLVMIGGAVYFQATGMYEAMNAVLFAAFLAVIGGSLALAAGEWNMRSGAYGSYLALAQSISAVGLPPSLFFVAQWMFVSAMLTNIGTMGRNAAAVVVVVLVLWFKAMWNRGKQAVKELHTQQPASETHWPPIVLLVATVLGAFATPWALNRIGAAPLASAADTWSAAVISGGNMLRLIVLIGMIAAFTIIIWATRDRSKVDIALEYHEDAPRESAQSRMAAFRRDVARLSRQYLLVSYTMRAERIKQWFEHRAHRVISPGILFMLAVIVLVLIFAV